MNKHLIVALSAGVLLTVGCNKKDDNADIRMATPDYFQPGWFLHRTKCTTPERFWLTCGGMVMSFSNGSAEKKMARFGIIALLLRHSDNTATMQI